ncbi:MAG: hypothetical protein DI582_10705 [Azospirillum brasilense]|nr:MAG: hypothetical protein DI582_10705 [Azospirillum brasilense]
MPTDQPKAPSFTRRDILAGGGALAALLATGGCAAKNEKQSALEELGINPGKPHIVYVTINGCTVDGPHDYANLNAVVNGSQLDAYAISLTPTIDRYIKRLTDNTGRSAPGQIALAKDDDRVLQLATKLGLFVDGDNRFRHSGLMLLFNARNEQIAFAESKADPSRTIALFQNAIAADQGRQNGASR